jgi:hypothetical protein
MDSAPDKEENAKLDENLVAAILLAKAMPIEVLDMINDAHNMIAGYHGVKRTRATILGDPTAKEDRHLTRCVREFIRQCSCCQKMSPNKPHILTHP